MEISKRNTAVVAAHTKGYKVADGEVLSPRGRILKCSKIVDKRSGYVLRRFNVSVTGEKWPMNVMVHKLAAYQKFGEAVFVEGIQVRHLDGDSLNNRTDNIAIGTCAQNHMDKPAECRKKAAASANQTHTPELIVALTRKHQHGNEH